MENTRTSPREEREMIEALITAAVNQIASDKEDPEVIRAELIRLRKNRARRAAYAAKKSSRRAAP